MKMLKRRLHEIVELALPGDTLSRCFDLCMMGLILLNIVGVVLESVHGLSLRFATAFRAVEVVSVTLFSVEYLLRLWTCTEEDRFRRSVVGRLKFALTLLALVDLAAILPFYLPALIPFDLRFVRGLRLLRMFRVLKLGRYSESVRLVVAVIRGKKEELLVTAFVGLLLLVVSSSLMYFVERDAQPDVFSSIPATMWWGVVTLTTVGYGDTYPVTAVGKVLGAFVAFLGIGMFALPAGLLASGFSEEISKRRVKGGKCPHCGAPSDHMTEQEGRQ